MKISFIINAYNHERFVAEALRGALEQTRQPDELIVSDDGSTDDTPKIIESVLAAARPPYPVKLFLRKNNVGLLRNFEHSVSQVTGDWVVLQGGDDRSSPDRASALEALATSNSRARLVHSDGIRVDETGRELGLMYPARSKEDFSLEDLLRMPAIAGHAHGATMCLHRDMMKTFRPMHGDVLQEDLVLASRAAMLGEIVFLDRPLVYYRVVSYGITSTVLGDARRLRNDTKTRERRRRNELAVTKTRLADLRRAREVGLVSADEAARLAAILRPRLLEARVEWQLQRASRLGVVGWTARGLRRGVSLKRAARDCAYYGFPELYDLYRFLRRR